MRKVRRLDSPVLMAVLALCLCASGFLQVNLFAQPTLLSNEEIKQEKRFFDFLIGEWRIERTETPDGVETRSDDIYKFRKVIGGHGILSEWSFNRGTRAKPDFTNAMYLTAFDTSSRVWTFYYISEKSAQWWEGRRENGQWFFYKTFTIDGKETLQRQTWLPEGKSTLIRIIENSKDGGRSWATYRFILRRKA